MLKTLARRWKWVSRAIILVSIAPVAILSAWLGIFVWRTEVTYHIGQTLTIANEFLRVTYTAATQAFTAASIAR